MSGGTGWLHICKQYFKKYFNSLNIYIQAVSSQKSNTKVNSFVSSRLKMKIIVCMCVYLFHCVYVCSVSHMWAHVIGCRRLMPGLIAKCILHLLHFWNRGYQYMWSSLIGWDGVHWGPGILYYLPPSLSPVPGFYLGVRSRTHLHVCIPSTLLTEPDLHFPKILFY